MNLGSFSNQDRDAGLIQVKDNQSNFKGTKKDGKKHGMGELTLSLGEDRKAIIKGTWKSGYLNGKA